MNEDRQRLLIIGASARAAAFSARRAGFLISAIDLFGDHDLRACSEIRISQDYPRDLFRLAGDLPDSAWLYTGGLENEPSMIDWLAGARTLLGNRGAILRRVRDPWQLAACLSKAGFEFPDLASSSQGLPADGSWLRKALRSSGGHQVEPWLGQKTISARSKLYFQRRIEGEACAAVYVAAGGRAAFIGITQQLVGLDWCGTTGFHYCGSIGPLDISADLNCRLQTLGDVLASDFNLSGIFGVDLIMAATGKTHFLQRPHADNYECEPDIVRHARVFPIEVNPRYPASAEILEQALGFSLIGAHVAACRDQTLPALSSPGGKAGKATLFATHDAHVSQQFAERLIIENASAGENFFPRIADIPCAGTTIRRGRPICTLLEQGMSAAEIEARLRRRAADWYRAMAAL